VITSIVFELLDESSELLILVADRAVVDRAQALDVGQRRDDRATHAAGAEAELLRGAVLLERPVVRTG
jgi:hypothetical protein